MLNKCFLTFLNLLYFFVGFAQLKVGDNPTSIDASAILEMESSDKGMLLPRLTTAQKLSISSASEGLLVYDTDLECLSIFVASQWNCMMMTASSIGTINNPGQSCKDILDKGGSVGDGLYYIDPDGVGGNLAFRCHCDMTTDGGGWTLVGRGREGWAWNNAGKLTSNVHQNIGTINAFVPAYYAGSVIDDIIDKDLHTLTDGLRIKRNAYNVTDGSAYQEVRWYFHSSQPNFNWVFDTGIGQTLTNVTIDGSTYNTMAGVTTRDANYAANGNNQVRIFTWGWSAHASIKGFSYGASVNLGTNSATNFLWENTTENHSIPYTEVYVRE